MRDCMVRPGDMPVASPHPSVRDLCDSMPELRSHLLFLWDEYATERDENMTGDARRLAADTRALFAEMSALHARRPPG